MKMKKLLAVALSALLVSSAVVGVTACDPASESGGLTPVAKEDVKIGMICLHDNSSTYDKNFIDAMERARVQLGLREDQILMETGIAEDQNCYDTAANFADQGCNVIFADSFGHEDYMIQAAMEFSEVQFCHATGTKAHTENLSNYHNAFASIYEGRYLAGIAAGMKLNEMIEAGQFTADQAKMGYVGAYTYAEVISGYTSFYLGAKSVCPTVTMDVQFTGEWYHETNEQQAALALIDGGAKLISQHADSLGAPTACEQRSVPNVSYNGSTATAGPNTYIISSKIDWTPYFVYMINCVINGEAIATDWTGTIETGSVKLETINETVAAQGTAAAIEAAKAKLISGELKVFDTAKFTVQGQTLTSYLADVDSDKDYVHETEAIVNGIFEESKLRSAPYFDVQIDGITLLNAKY